MNPLPDVPPMAALRHFGPATDGLTWHRASDGFSGAEVWRGEAGGAPGVALKGWPVDTPPGRVAQVHFWLKQAAPLPFVPAVLPGAHGLTAVRAGRRVWDATQWVPGRPLVAPTAADVRAACAAIAELHRAWPAEPPDRPCRAVAAQLDILTNRRALYAGGPLPRVGPELDDLVDRGARAVARLAGAAVAALRPWAARPLAARPCVRDLRAAHVLFDAGRVTGVVDYGAMGVDTPAVDLARLLGDYAAADPGLLGDGLGAYRAAGPLDAPDALVATLARTGAVCSVLGWLVRLFVRREPGAPAGRVAARLRELVARAEAVRHL